MKEQLTQKEKDIQDLDAVVDLLSKSRIKAESLKVVTADFGIARIADSSFLSIFTLSAEKWALQQTPLRNFFVGNLSPICNSQPPSRGLEAHVDPSPQKEMHMNLGKIPDSSVSPKNPSTCLSNEPFDPMAFLKMWGDKMQLMQQHPQTIVVESRANKLQETNAKFNNHMLQLLLVSGDVDFTPPGTFSAPRIPIYTQATVNILAQPSLVRSIHPVNILTTCFNQVPTDLAKCLSPLMTHKSMQHILKKNATVFISANFQRTSLDSLKFKTSLVTMLSFVGQNDIAKIKAHCEAEQLAKNECNFHFIDTHCNVLKTTIKGLGMITGMECIIKICANICCVITALFDVDGSNPVLLLYSVCIKTIDFVKSLDFIQWHATVHARVPQLLFIFLNMLQQVLSQLAIYSTNTVNIDLVECGDNRANAALCNF
jgi:hypothetical protein